jgi:Zn ribbon nucleic-acid-binding protein
MNGYVFPAGYKPMSAARIPACPKCGRKDRLETWREGTRETGVKQVVVCMRCGISGEIRREGTP